MDQYKSTLTARVTPEDLRDLTTRARQTYRTRSDYLRGIINTLKDNPELRREIERKMEAVK